MCYVLKNKKSNKNIIMLFLSVAAVASMLFSAVAVAEEAEYCRSELSVKLQNVKDELSAQSQSFDEMRNNYSSFCEDENSVSNSIKTLSSNINSANQTADSVKKKIEDQKKKKEEENNKASTNQSSTEIKKDSEQSQYPTPSGEKVCYLTFDDGPSQNTLKIIDILKKYGVTATFFVTGNGTNSYMKKITESGNTIALHTYSHDYKKIYSSTKAYFEDLNKIKELVKKETGVESNIIRFPGGSSNTISRQYCKGIMSTITKEVEKQGYYYFDWNVDSTDASGNNVAASKLINNIKTYSKGINNVVVLMHDTGSKNTTVEALPKIIEYYKSQGYVIKGLSEDSKTCHHGVNN